MSAGYLSNSIWHYFNLTTVVLLKKMKIKRIIVNKLFKIIFWFFELERVDFGIMIFLLIFIDTNHMFNFHKLLLEKRYVRYERFFLDFVIYLFNWCPGTQVSFQFVFCYFWWDGNTSTAYGWNIFCWIK